MAQLGERVDNHDRICAEQLATLTALGMYDEEPVLFGVSYVNEGKNKCCVSADREVIVKFIADCREQQIYPTMMEEKIKRIRVHTGEKEQVEKQFKLEFAQSLKKMYPPDFLSGLQHVAQCPINNKAANLLTRIRENLEGCFDEAALKLFRGAIEFAYDGKILTTAEYAENKLWLKRELDFLTEKPRITSNYRRLMSGFAYIDSGEIEYYSTALEKRTQQRRLELMSEGKIVSAVYNEEYRFNNYADLSKGVNWFDSLLKSKLNKEYVQLLIDLYKMKPEIDINALKNLESSYVGNKYIEKTIGYYKTMWHLN